MCYVGENMTNKQSLSIVLGILFVCSAAQADTLMFWGSNTPMTTGGPGVDITDRFGTAIPITSTWAAEIVTLAGTVLYTATSDGQWAATGYTGQFFDPIDAPDSWIGDSVRTIVYDNSNPASANFEAISGTTTLNWVTSPETPSVNYNIGTINAQAWPVIPEPGTLALLGLGIGTIVGSRRMMKKYGGNG
jgi:hypothetical protein